MDSKVIESQAKSEILLLQNENEIEAHSLDQSKPFIFYLKIRHFSVLVEPKHFMR